MWLQLYDLLWMNDGGYWVKSGANGPEAHIMDMAR